MRKIICLVGCILTFFLINLIFTQSFESPWAETPFKEHKALNAERLTQTLKLWEMKKILELTDEQNAKFSPLIQKFEKEKVRFRNEKKALYKELEKLVDDPKVTDKELKDKINDIKKKQEEFEKLEREYHEELENILTIKQQAKFILFQKRFGWRMRKGIERIMD